MWQSHQLRSSVLLVWWLLLSSRLFMALLVRLDVDLANISPLAVEGSVGIQQEDRLLFLPQGAFSWLTLAENGDWPGMGQAWHSLRSSGSFPVVPSLPASAHLYPCGGLPFTSFNPQFPTHLSQPDNPEAFSSIHGLQSHVSKDIWTPAMGRGSLFKLWFFFGYFPSALGHSLALFPFLSS